MMPSAELWDEVEAYAEGAGITVDDVARYIFTRVDPDEILNEAVNLGVCTEALAYAIAEVFKGVG